MPVPSTLSSLSTTPGSNSPGGGENPFPELDDHLRQGYAFTAQLRDQKLNSSAVSAYMLTVLDDANAGAARTTLGAVGNSGNETIAGVKTFSSAPVSSAAAAAANELMRKGEVDTALQGSASQTFAVAPATDSTHAVRLGQINTANAAPIKTALNASGASPIFGARAWALFDMTRDSTGAASSANTNRFIHASGGVSSVLRVSASSFEVNFSSPLTQNGYAPFGMTLHEPGVYAGLVCAQAIGGVFPADKCLMSLHKSTDSGPITPGLVSVAFFGN